jgi:hypothetical protein
MSQDNPLRQYFRQPAIYLRLPSNGEFYPPGGIDLPPNREIPILPMTAIDEITYRTPDALFNGTAVVNVIQSCCPNIKNAWYVPAMDVDSLLVGIRIASYGHNMEFDTTCPHCGNTSTNALDLRSVLDQMKSPDYKKSIQYRDLEIYFRPMTYKDMNDNNQAQFEEQKILQMLPDSTVPDEQKMEVLSAALKKITEVTVGALSQSIDAIKTPSALVNDNANIKEFLQNCDRSLFNQIREHIIKIKEEAELKPFELTCDNEECKKTYMQAVTLDMTSFFGGAS